MGEIVPPVCDPADIAEVLPRTHQQPAGPVCVREYDPSTMRALASPPCREIGYCILVQLGE